MIKVEAMLPKKRKFTPSEFETFNVQSNQEDDNGSNENETTSDIGIDLSIRSRSESDARQTSANTAFKTVAARDRNSVVYETSTPESAVKYEFHHENPFEPDLSDWIGHRILARRDNYFSSGVISNVFDVTSVVVSFDAEETPLVYHDVLRRESYGCIISDAAPSTKQVLIKLFIS